MMKSARTPRRQDSACAPANGTAKLRGLGGDVIRIDVAADGYVRRGSGFEVSGEPGGRFAHTVVMGHGTTVHGRVVDPDGKPVPRARIVAAGTETSSGADTEADDAGAFTLFLEEEGEWEITARGGPGLVSAATEVDLRAMPPDEDQDEGPLTASTPPTRSSCASARPRRSPAWSSTPPARRWPAPRCWHRAAARATRPPPAAMGALRSSASTTTGTS